MYFFAAVYLLSKEETLEYTNGQPLANHHHLFKVVAPYHFQEAPCNWQKQFGKFREHQKEEMKADEIETYRCKFNLLQNADLPLFALPFSKEGDQKEDIKVGDSSKC